MKMHQSDAKYSPSGFLTASQPAPYRRLNPPISCLTALPVWMMHAHLSALLWPLILHLLIQYTIWTVLRGHKGEAHDTGLKKQIACLSCLQRRDQQMVKGQTSLPLRPGKTHQEQHLTVERNHGWRLSWIQIWREWRVNKCQSFLPYRLSPGCVPWGFSSLSPTVEHKDWVLFLCTFTPCEARPVSWLHCHIRVNTKSLPPSQPFPKSTGYL